MVLSLCIRRNREDMVIISTGSLGVRQLSPYCVSCDVPIVLRIEGFCC